MAIVNLKKMYFAELTKDEMGEAPVFGTPEYMPSIRQISAQVNSIQDKLYAEGILWEQAESLEDIAISIDLADLSNAQQAKYLGHNLAEEGGVYANEADTAPYIALLFVAEKSNGKAAYRVYYKGKLAEPNEGFKGKEGKTEFQTHQVTATFQPLKSNGMWRYAIDEDDEDCPTDIATTFFSSVIIPQKKIA